MFLAHVIRSLDTSKEEKLQQQKSVVDSGAAWLECWLHHVLAVPTVRQLFNPCLGLNL